MQPYYADDGPTGHNGILEPALFDVTRDPSIFLRDRYQEPPFSVLDRRGGAWIDRDRRWKALGIQSEVGRSGKLVFGTQFADSDRLTGFTTLHGTSIFSPTLCEIVYRWYSRPGAQVLDPFAGGAVRGVVAAAMGRQYTGIELRPEQIEANRTQQFIGGHPLPRWIEGDALDIGALVGFDYVADLMFGCPPYAFLERYSDDPRDLSTMPYPQFRLAYRSAILEAADLLADNRFAAWVVGEVREKEGADAGARPMVGFVADTIAAFRSAGLRLYNDHVVLRPVGTAAVRAPAQFDKSRKAAGVHEYLLVFVKGDARAAAEWCNAGAVTAAVADAAEDYDETEPGAAAA